MHSVNGSCIDLALSYGSRINHVHSQWIPYRPCTDGHMAYMSRWSVGSSLRLTHDLPPHWIQLWWLSLVSQTEPCVQHQASTTNLTWMSTCCCTTLSRSGMFSGRFSACRDISGLPIQIMALVTGPEVMVFVCREVCLYGRCEGNGQMLVGMSGETVEEESYLTPFNILLSFSIWIMHSQKRITPCHSGINY